MSQQNDSIHFSPHARFLGNTPIEKRAEFRVIVGSALIESAILHAYAQMAAHPQSTRDELNGALKFIATFQNISEPMPTHQTLPQKNLQAL